MVKIPYLSSHLDGQDHEKLNQAYLYGNPGDGFHYWDDPSAGPGLLALTLNVNFGVNVDHYLAVNMQTFVKMVDAVGGIDVTFKKPVALSRQSESSNRLTPSRRTLALEVARNRVDLHVLRVATIRTSSYVPCKRNSPARGSSWKSPI